MFKKILIANRGEIAIRIIRACKEMGMSTVAVYSEADRTALHTRMADEAVCIGAPPSQQSYLAQEKILQAARRLKAEAIHPGYGFLAENGDFAELVENSGLCFIGPPASAIRLMGDKTAARQKMREAGVPTVPGMETELETEEQAQQIAQSLGYPILLKAAAGGGGKGMRIVWGPEEIKRALRGARSEAQAAFGDPRIYIEKYLEKPRHIEFQILADNDGNVIHLGERECSIQRRHQKVIEEAPSCVLNDQLRQEMGQVAVRAAQACGYRNAGTIEFLVDRELNYYFLEMNTRLQVEHPVTEMITGLDLVKEQIKLAWGNPLSLTQNTVSFRGHAIECRIYAEDPYNDFLPSTGTIEYLRPPYGFGIREDSGVYEGAMVCPYYDPLLSKLITWGQDRQEAIGRMRRALLEYQIAGVETTIPFCQMVMNNEKFIQGDFDTHFVENEFKNESGMSDYENSSNGNLPEMAALGAVLVDWYSKKKENQLLKFRKIEAISNWKRTGRYQQMR